VYLWDKKRILLVFVLGFIANGHLLDSFQMFLKHLQNTQPLLLYVVVPFKAIEKTSFALSFVAYRIRPNHPHLKRLPVNPLLVGQHPKPGFLAMLLFSFP
jgi:hypothetical protein